ncbi:MAG TPA: hypothetical protein VHQ65_11350 [Thermoanaerobaculia bacterium]|nr:hypothetical protein [Thermoanaerobaculia bacterium]
MAVAEPVPANATAGRLVDPYVQQLAPPWYPAFQRQRTPTDAGTWTAVRINWQGNLVVQLGAEPSQPNSPHVQGDLLVAYRRTLDVVTAVQEWRARIEPVAVTTRRPGGSAAEVYAFLQVRGASNYIDLQPLVAGQPLVLRAGSGTTGGYPVRAGRYELRVGLYLLIDYRGYDRPYGEGIANVPYLEHWGPAADSAAREAATATLQRHGAAFERRAESLVSEGEPRGTEAPSVLVELEG